MDTTLYCPHCGTSARGTRFCTTCGTSLSSTATVDGGTPSAELPTEVIEAPTTNPAAAPATSTAVLPAPPLAGEEQSAPWLSAQPVAPPPRTRPNVLAVLVVAALALSGWAIWRGVEEHTLSGTVMLADSTYFGLEAGAPCTGEGGYADLGGGAQVVLTDDRGETLSTGRLSAGVFDGLGCVFSFALEDVPRADFYGLTIAGGSRGHLQYSYDELADDNWSVQLSIGED